MKRGSNGPRFILLATHMVIPIYPSYGIILYLVGCGLILIAFLFLRRPGMTVWTAFYPVWLAHRVFTSRGVLIWKAGWITALVGVFVYFTS